MVLKFVTPAEAALAFKHDLVSGLLVTLVMLFAAFLLLSQRPEGAPRKLLTLAAIAGFFVSITVAYWPSYQRFVSADVWGHGVQLSYTGPFERRIFLPRKSIKNILFGLPAKHADECYIRIETTAGESLRSATVNLNAPACKAMRQAILTTLSLPP